MHHMHIFSVFGALSVVVAIFTAWTALDLLNQVKERHGSARLPWLLTASAAMGGGIWAMHFIAMLGFDPGLPVAYDLGLTLLSLGLALAGTSLAFFIAGFSHNRLLTLGGGLVMGLSISAMHYVGMAAIRTDAVFVYSPGLVALSIVIGVGASVAALLAAEEDGSTRWKVFAALVLGLAVVGMHYSGMAALTVLPGTPPEDHMHGASPLTLAFAVAGVSLAILVLAVIASMLSQRDKLMAIIDAGGIGYWELPLSSRTPWMSPRARRFLNLPPDARFSASDLEAYLQTIEPQARKQALERALYGDGEYDLEYFLPSSRRWLHFRGRVLRSRTGKPTRVAGIVIDVTDRHIAFSALETSEHRQRLLINELNHRVKNTLATIQSIAALTARRTTTTDEFMTLFEARLVALSDTHNLLTANGWERARLRNLIQQEFRPYADDQLRIEGPDITLGPEQALSMGMVLHEMVTNAAKYGALSTRESRGRIFLRWTAPDDDGAVQLTWTEEGGPRVAPSTRRGFGSRLIETSIRGVLGGTVASDYSSGALRCEMRFYPSSNNRPEPEIDPGGAYSAAPGPSGSVVIRPTVTNPGPGVGARIEP